MSESGLPSANPLFAYLASKRHLEANAPEGANRPVAGLRKGLKLGLKSLQTSIATDLEAHHTVIFSQNKTR
ncbi:hypothetical protein [Levilactobacillus sp. N40-8-2]|uniref:hypothetical protein n=1 Tax=Levilactobacillus muriae TaxID=3238987 RepID=UPI0038B276F1